MFLHLGKLKKTRGGVLSGEKRSELKVEKRVICLGPGWVLRKVSRRRNKELCDYAAFRSTLSL